VNDPAFTRVLGMLLLGQENCELQVVERNEQDELDKEEQAATASRLGRSKEKKKESTKTKKQRNTKEGGGFFSNVEDFFGNMFSDDDE
jgi:cell division protein FtsA